MLLIKAALPIGGRRIADYIDAWKRLLHHTRGDDERQVQQALFSHLYENLNILDNKTNSLIQLGGIVIAAYVFLMSDSPVQMPDSQGAMLVFGVSYAIASVLLCLRVIWVHWSSLTDLRNPDAHMRALIKVRTQRTVEFRRAWTFCFISIAVLLILVVNVVIERWNLDISAGIFPAIIVHLTIIYLYDDFILAVRHRNITLRLHRLASAVVRFPPRWRWIGRALRFRGARVRARRI